MSNLGTALMDIAVNLQKKYNKINELQDTTKQMGDSLQRNDLYAFQLLMKIRTGVMLEVDSIDYQRDDLLQCLPETEKKLVLDALSTKVQESQLELPEIRRIHEIYMKIERSLESTIRYDKAISVKIGGNDSFYKS